MWLLAVGNVVRKHRELQPALVLGGAQICPIGPALALHELLPSRSVGEGGSDALALCGCAPAARALRAAAAFEDGTCLRSNHGAGGRGREADALIPPSRYEAGGRQISCSGDDVVV